MRNLGNALTFLALAAAGRITATATGTGQDISDYIDQVIVTLASGVGGGTTPTSAVKLQVSDALNGTYTDVDGGAFTGLVGTGSATMQSLILDTRVLNKYIRVVETIAGTTPTFDRSIILTGRKKLIS